MKQAESIIRMTMEESTKIVNFMIPRAGDQKYMKKNLKSSFQKLVDQLQPNLAKNIFG